MASRYWTSLMGITASLVVHGSLALALVRLDVSERTPGPVEIELTKLGHGSAGGEGTAAPAARPLRAPPPAPGDHPPFDNLDTARRTRPGRALGGQQTTLRLIAQTDPVLLESAPANHGAQAQVQRIRTAVDRASLEDRRATPNPAATDFLASGAGRHPERRDPSLREPQPGTPRGGPGAVPRRRHATAVATAQGDVAVPEARAPTAESQAQRARQPRLGILRAAGDRAARAAPVDHGRPPLPEGPAATPAREVDARVRDNRNAELLATPRPHARLRTSPPRGAKAGASGGSGFALAASAGGDDQGTGSRSSAHATGPGSDGALDTRDSRYLRWFSAQRERIARALVYPKARLVALDQGTSVFTVRVDRDGRLVSAPRLVRSSGFADLDAAARRALEASTPFQPLPANLEPQRQVLRIRVPIAFSNPMIR